MGDYSVGYFDVAGRIVAVKGEKNALDTARHDDAFPCQVFWSEEALLTARADRQREVEENALIAELFEHQRQEQLAHARALRAARG